MSTTNPIAPARTWPKCVSAALVGDRVLFAAHHLDAAEYGVLRAQAVHGCWTREGLVKIAVEIAWKAIDGIRSAGIAVEFMNEEARVAIEAAANKATRGAA